MRKHGVCLIVVLAAFTATAQFNVDFQRKYNERSAERLFEKRKYAEARDAFKKLAATAPDQENAAKWLCWEAIALGFQKGKCDEALELGKAIENKPYSSFAQLKILSQNKKDKELIETFKEADIAKWPTETVNESFYLRGCAWSRVGGNDQAAIKDYAECVKRVKPKDRMWPKSVNSLASHQKNLGDDEEALKTYQDAFTVYDQGLNWKNGTYHAQSIYGAATTLQKLKRFDEALELLAKYDVKSDTMDYRLMELAGDISVEKKDEDQAAGLYKKTIERLNEHAKTRPKRAKNYQRCAELIQKKIDALATDAEKTK